MIAAVIAVSAPERRLSRKAFIAYIMYYYQPNKIGADTVHHSAKHSSVLILPVTEGY